MRKKYFPLVKCIAMLMSLFFQSLLALLVLAGSEENL